MAKGKDMKAFEQILADKKAARDKLNIEIAAIENAIRVASGADKKVKRRAPRSNVKSVVLELLEAVGTDGMNAASAVQMASDKGITLERGTVSSLLSRLKNEGLLTYDNIVYRLKEPDAPSPDGAGQVVNLRASNGSA